MKFKAYTGITWSLLELAGLLEDEDSHVHYEKIKKHLGLHPFHLTNLSAALSEILSSGLNSYDSELHGFLLAYKNPKLLTALGDTFYDSYFIHVDIEADFYVFRPKVGCTLKGIVNKKGYNHIGVLVHKAFNVSIPKLEHAKQWPGDQVEIGQEVKFKITHLDLTSRLPFIRGSLDPQNYLEGCKLLTIVKKKRKSATNEPFYGTNNDSDDSCDGNVEIHQSPSKQKTLKELEKQVSSEKRLKKRHLDDEDIQAEENIKHSKKRLKTSTQFNHSEFEEEHNEPNNVNIVNNVDTPIKKRKKSEKRSKKKSLEASQISESEFDYSNATVKVEKDLTSHSDNESTTEIEVKKCEKKSKKQSKKLKYHNDTNCSIDNEVIQKEIKAENKKHSKKHKLSDSDIINSSTPIKLEGSSNSNNITKHLSDENNYDAGSHRRKSSVKRIKQSVTDSESEFGNIQVKVEKSTSESEHTQGEDDREEKVLKVIKKEKSTNKTNCSINDTENESSPSVSPKKHKKKREKVSEEECDFGNVTIKQEKSDDYSSKHTPQSKKSSNDEYIDNINHTIKDEYDAQHKTKIKKSPKKSKVRDSDSEFQEPRIKVEEETIKSEFKDKERTPNNISPKKHSRNESEDRDVKVFDSQLDYSTMVEPKETKHNISSPKKRSKKSKESKYEILPGNVRVKIERSSSVES